MIYLGLTMCRQSIEAMFGTALEDAVKTLAKKQCRIRIESLDKGIYALGIPLDIFRHNMWTRGNNLFQTLTQIMEAKIAFDEDIQSLGISLENVTIDFMEDGSEIRLVAEPTLFEW